MRESGIPVTEVRYERLVAEPTLVAAELAGTLDVAADAVSRALAAAHTGSVGRWQRDLTPEQLADVEAEGGDLLADL